MLEVTESGLSKIHQNSWVNLPLHRKKIASFLRGVSPRRRWSQLSCPPARWRRWRCWRWRRGWRQPLSSAGWLDSSPHRSHQGSPYFCVFGKKTAKKSAKKMAKNGFSVCKGSRAWDFKKRHQTQWVLFHPTIFIQIVAKEPSAGSTTSVPVGRLTWLKRSRRRPVAWDALGSRSQWWSPDFGRRKHTCRSICPATKRAMVHNTGRQWAQTASPKTHSGFLTKRKPSWSSQAALIMV